MSPNPQHAIAPDALLVQARERDAADPLSSYRERFALPPGPDGEPLIYLCGHSLGLAPRSARARVAEELDDWERLGVNGHHRARRPWIEYAEQLQAPLAALTGAKAAEVVAMNGLSVNLHLLMASFYRPEGARTRILIEAGAFASDRHAVASQIAWHGLDPSAELIELAPRSGDETLRAEDIDAAIAGEGERLALVLWPGVQYRTGQAFDIARVARAAHSAGALAGFDLAHAIGNVPLALHAAGADFAVWCSYKYLNAGPGALAGAFVHESQHGAVPRLDGWWGHELPTRFAMGPEHVASHGASAWQISNPPILSAAPLFASLQIFSEVGMPALRARSERLTAWLEQLLQHYCGDSISILTPGDPSQRGCQLSVRVAGGPEHARAVFGSLQKHGVVADWREPDVMRLSPVPLYNRFEDAWHAATRLAAALRRDP